MPKIEVIQEVLSAFAGLFTQPFEQELNAALKSAAMSIVLASLPGLRILVNHGGDRALEMGGDSLVLVLCWMAFTAVFSKADSRRLTIARNLSVVSFWIAVTLVLALVAELVFTDPLDRAMRLISIWALLLLLVPVHVFRNSRLPRLTALLMTLLLLLSTGVLTYRTIY